MQIFFGQQIDKQARINNVSAMSDMAIKNVWRRDQRSLLDFKNVYLIFWNTPGPPRGRPFVRLGFSLADNGSKDTRTRLPNSFRRDRILEIKVNDTGTTPPNKDLSGKQADILFIFFCSFCDFHSLCFRLPSAILLFVFPFALFLALSGHFWHCFTANTRPSSYGPDPRLIALSALLDGSAICIHLLSNAPPPVSLGPDNGAVFLANLADSVNCFWLSMKRPANYLRLYLAFCANWLIKWKSVIKTEVYLNSISFQGQPTYTAWCPDFYFLFVFSPGWN